MTSHNNLSPTHKLCAINLHILRDILIMFGISIFQFKTVCLVECLLSLASCLNYLP